MKNYQSPLDAAFHALADPTRRAVVSRLTKGPAPVKELAEPFDMGLPSFMKHLRVLEEGGLTSSETAGPLRTSRVTPASPAAPAPSPPGRPPRRPPPPPPLPPPAPPLPSPHPP